MNPLVPHQASRWSMASEPAESSELLAEETAIALLFNGVPYAVMMATPADLHDFAVGFALSEGIIESASELAWIEQVEREAGLALHLKIPADRFESLEQRRRLLAASGCDPQRISELEPGRSTEVDVRDRFGVPDHIWDAGGGLRTFEYNRQPAGQRNYMIDIGADGRLVAVRQVLTPENFARIQPGMDMAEVRRLLGKPAKVTPFDLKNETHHDWRYLEAPNSAMLFTVVTDRSLRVLRTQSGPDLAAPENAGGGR